MKKLFAILFALSTVLQPGVLRCVEASGDSHFEYVTACCCNGTVAASIDSAPGVTANGCRGCSDQTLTTDTFSYRFSDNDALALDFSAPGVPVAREPDMHRFRGNPQLLQHSSYTPHLSSTVIRR